VLHCVGLLQCRYATALLAATIAILAGEAAADTLRVGRPSTRGFGGVPLVTGVKHGFFRAQGLDLELAVFGGGRTSQAMTAGAVDISVQSGTEMAFLANGVPGKAVAALAGLPNELVLVVRPDLPIRAAVTSRGARSPSPARRSPAGGSRRCRASKASDPTVSR
jgi:ABC-type nitrate/sulfonate/bicarbonate transport system substrate-binding protein